MIDRRAPQAAGKFRDQLEIAFAVLERGDGSQEIARVGKPVGSDGTELGQPEVRAVVFAHIAACSRSFELHLEPQAARDQRDLAGLHFESSQLGREVQRALLRDEQQLSVRVVEVARLHRAVTGVDVHGDAGLHRRIAVARDRDEALDEVRRHRRQR